VKYVLTGRNLVTFEVASYDRSRGLVIDPVLSYSTYLGGAGNDLGTDIAVDQSGSIYITGITFSSDFPTEDPVQAARGGQDIFVTKLTADGSALAYSTYLGGSDDDEALGIAVDLAGEAYVAGQTLSSDFPTASPFQGTKRSSFDTAFVTKLRPDGSGLAYSTYLGGSGGEGGLGIAVDSAGSAYVAGTTFSEDFPVTPGAFQTESRNLDAFVAKLSPDGSSLAYSTFLGGSGSEEAWGIAVDSSGSAYLTGSTDSIDFPRKTHCRLPAGPAAQ